MIGGKEEVHTEGAYYLEWRESGKRIRLSVGNDPVQAAVERQRKEAELAAIRSGLKVTGTNGSKTLAVAVDEYLSDTSLTKKPKTLAAYRTALFSGILPSAARRGHHPIRSSQIRCFPAGREGPSATNLRT